MTGHEYKLKILIKMSLSLQFSPFLPFVPKPPRCTFLAPGPSLCKRSVSHISFDEVILWGI